MIEILNIFLQQYSDQDVFSLCKCNIVCKELTICIEEWNVWSKCKFVKKDYGEICIKCDKKSTAFGYCEKCLPKNLITATDCKKYWYMNDADLLQLNVYNTRNKLYRTNIRLFYEREIKEYVLIKYGGSKKLAEHINKKKQRLAKLQQTKAKTKEKKHEMIETRMKVLVERLSEKNLAMSDDHGTCERYITNQIDDIDYVIRILQDVKDRKRKVQERREILKAKLQEQNLNLRNDSRVCSDYIYGKRDDIDNVVLIMMEMNYFFSKTNYKNIMDRLMSDLKTEIRESYGYLDSDEYHDMIESEIPLLSDTAKRTAIRNKKDVPEYCQKYLS